MLGYSVVRDEVVKDTFVRVISKSEEKSINPYPCLSSLCPTSWSSTSVYSKMNFLLVRHFLLFVVILSVMAQTSVSQCPDGEIECGMWCCLPGLVCINHKCVTSGGNFMDTNNVK